LNYRAAKHARAAGHDYRPTGEVVWIIRRIDFVTHNDCFFKCASTFGSTALHKNPG
jgi:hypothetical protein